MSTGLQVEERNRFSRLDLNFAFVILALNVIGLINLYSATHGLFSKDRMDLFWMQIVWLSVGWTVYLGITLIDYKVFLRGAYVLYGLNVAALVAVELIGKTSLGATRWLDLGFFRYQPSETMKLVLVLVFARTFANKSFQGGMGLRELAWPVFLLMIPWVLTVKQPDLGTATLLIAIAGSMFLFVGVRRAILIFLVIISAIAAPIVWNFGLKDYQKNRVLTFLSPGRDPRGTGYNSIQSKIAVGSGKVLGKGFRKGTQSQLEFLPERHTDFIFSVLSEEHGFIGSITTLGLFLILWLMSIRIAVQARDKAGALIVVGTLSYMFWHVVVNMCMVIGLLPIVGVPLPLLSYGGSGMLTTMVGLGLISSVAYRRYLF
ncbi:MAG: rod shape-determining protein RodA [Bdellovibrionales bacterium]|nr:rod shape-determining protein RodA [Bdellovibrionales bacterium]